MKLWSNPDPSQAFGAQTITLPDNDCTEFVVSFRESNASAYQVVDIKVPVGGVAGANFVGGTQGLQSGELVQWSRLITATTQNSITFASAIAIGRITGTNPAICIPTEVIGIRL